MNILSIPLPFYFILLGIFALIYLAIYKYRKTFSFRKRGWFKYLINKSKKKKEVDLRTSSSEDLDFGSLDDEFFADGYNSKSSTYFLRCKKERYNAYNVGILIMQIVISLSVLGTALYIILSSKYQESEQKWAFGAIGTILGYWFKS